jgi:hypothetical protein
VSLIPINFCSVAKPFQQERSKAPCLHAYARVVNILSFCLVMLFCSSFVPLESYWARPARCHRSCVLRRGDLRVCYQCWGQTPLGLGERRANDARKRQKAQYRVHKCMASAEVFGKQIWLCVQTHIAHLLLPNHFRGSVQRHPSACLCASGELSLFLPCNMLFFDN